jgi:hypothetical protein
MKIEVVEYYPDVRSIRPPEGTLHVYYIDRELDIRGIKCFKKNDKWYIDIPHYYTTDEETQLRVRYPVISFIDKKEQKELLKLIREQGKIYIEEKLKSEKPD